MIRPFRKSVPEPPRAICNARLGANRTKRGGSRIRPVEEIVACVIRVFVPARLEYYFPFRKRTIPRVKGLSHSLDLPIGERIEYRRGLILRQRRNDPLHLRFLVPAGSDQVNLPYPLLIRHRPCEGIARNLFLHLLIDLPRRTYRPRRP